MKEIGVYIHIPFCKRKCFYCDFCSFEGTDELQKEYVNALTKEIKEKASAEYVVKTVYIGGGTPSILEAKYIKKILAEMRKGFRFTPEAEITLEVNPGTADYEKIKTYYEIGINRLSIGLQSTEDRLLKIIGRIHNFDQFMQVYMAARDVGFSNINVDLMIGLPTQTVKDVEKSLDKIIKLNPEHISVYSLILEEETKLSCLVNGGKLDLPDEDEERNMYWTVKKKLEENEYIHYEISNFAKSGFESKHNSDCWNQKEYLGFGLSAHSYLNGVRYSNTCDIKKYIYNVENNLLGENICIQEQQNEESKMNEYAILKLRMINGLDIKEFYRLFKTDFITRYKNQIQKLEKNNLVLIKNDNLKLTEKGIDFANVVWQEFI